MLSTIPQQDAGYLDQPQVVGDLLHSRNCAAYGEHDRPKGGLSICCSRPPKTCKGVELRIILAHAYCQTSQAIVLLCGRSVRSMTHAETPVTILKITGLGRSGSTILDIVLGNHPQIESVGEVGNLIRNGWISHESLRGIDQKRPRVPLCTCGKRLDVLYVDTPDEACPFWSSVRREWVERTDRDSIESYPKLRNDFELKRRWSRYGLDPLPRLLYEKRRPSSPFRSYARLTRAFFESIRAVSGKPIIVDSSKSPVRAFAFGMIPGIDLYVIHLVRDGRGVITSLRKTFKKRSPSRHHVGPRR